MSRPRFVTHPLVLRQVKVLRTVYLTPRLLRVTLGGPELGAFERNGLHLPAFSTPTFDDHIKLIFAADGNTEAVLPTQHEHGIDWVFSEQLITRDYTPRRFDAATQELDLDFVVHGHGPASSWAQKAQPGDSLWFVGPKSSTLLPEQIGQIVLLGDETALPAIARYLEERPHPAPVTGIIITETPDARLDLPLTDADSIQWMTGAASSPETWDQAVRSLSIALDTHPYVFAAGESRALLPVRHYLTRELGLSKQQLNITGYWHTEHNTSGDSEPQVTSAPALPESPLAWLAIRAALSIGLIQALAIEPRSTDDLTQELEVSPTGLLALVQALTESNILTYETGQVSLGDAGQLLLDDEHTIEHFVGYHADQLLSMLHLPQQLRSGAPSAWALAQGASLRARALTDPLVYEELLERAEVLEFVGQGALSPSAWEGCNEVLVHGPGAVSVAKIFEKNKLPISLTVIEQGAALSLLQEHWEQEKISLETDFHATWHPAPVGISALSSHAMTNDELTEHLKLSSTYVPRLVMFVEERTDQLIPRATEHDLLRFCMIGQSQRNETVIRRLAQEAGFSQVERQALGWGLAAYTLVQ